MQIRAGKLDVVGTNHVSDRSPARQRGHRCAPRPLLSTWIQPNLCLGHPNYVYERDADRVADQVMCMPDPTLSRSSIDPTPIRALSLQRKCQECEDEEKLQRRTHTPYTETPDSGLDSKD